jgi:hypothetical protein
MLVAAVGVVAAASLWSTASAAPADVAVFVNTMHWNAHWECFTSGNEACARGAEALLMSQLVGGGLDFVNLVEWGSTVLTVPEIASKFGLEGLVAECGDDVDVLLYNASRWALEAGNGNGTVCLDTTSHQRPDRAAMVRTFTHRAAQQLRLTVAGAHFSHSLNISGPLLRSALLGSDNVLLLADTNLGESVSNQQLFSSLGLSTPAAGSAFGRTCCANDGFTHSGYDRIVASAGTDAQNQLGFFKDNNTKRLPSWVDVTNGTHKSAFETHQPVFMSLTMRAPNAGAAAAVRASTMFALLATVRTLRGAF